MDAVKKLTINDIARLADTSKTTISFFLNGKTDKMSEETRERIKKVIAETGYHPSTAARSLNDKNSNLIGVIIGDITNGFANQLVKGIDRESSSKGYQMIVGNSNYSKEKESAYVDRMLHMGADGFIIQPSASFHEAADRLRKAGKKIVYIDSKNDGEGCFVNTDNYKATYETTQLCMEKGYDDYMMFTAQPSLLSTRMERAAGYEDALKEKGFTCAVQMIDHDTPMKIIQEYLVNHIRLDRRLLVFVPNCWLLPKVFTALKKYQNLIPTNIGLLGFDNTEWTYLSNPTITTIVQPAYEEGKDAAQLIIELIEGVHTGKRQRTLDCSICWGEST